jgi:AAA15 family ATPase/GTPase
MQPNVAVLAKLAQHGPVRGTGSVRPFYSALIRSLRYADFCTDASGAKEVGVDAKMEQFAADPEYRQWIMTHLMKKADVGIEDVHTSRVETKYPEFVKQFALTNTELKLPDSEVIISFVHRGRESTALDFKFESAGTKKLFSISDHWWRLAHREVCLFADELSASLHPRLLEALIRGLNAMTAKPRSQLVFATHDTGLLESRDGRSPTLRRDQVYFTNKGNDGATALYGLAEFKEDARPVHNLRKRYLSGLYGAIPSVEELPL